MELLIFPPMRSQNSPDTIGECTKLPVLIFADLKRFLCFTLIAQSTSSFLNTPIFTLCCKERTLLNRWFSPGFTFSLWTPSILEETNRSSFVSFAAKSSDFQLFYCITFQNILLNLSSTPRDPCSFLVLFGSRQSLDFPSFGHFILTCPGWLHFQQWPSEMKV